MQLQLNTNRSAARCSRRDQRTNSITRCFDAMRSNSLTFSARRASGVILPMIAVLLFLATAPKVGWGQSSCPSISGDCNSWNGPITITVSMAGEGASNLGEPPGTYPPNYTLVDDSLLDCPPFPDVAPPARHIHLIP